MTRRAPPPARKPLPSLNALLAFEAAARQLSFTRAAVELGVTQGAVSHQVRALEGEPTLPDGETGRREQARDALAEARVEEAARDEQRADPQEEHDLVKGRDPEDVPEGELGDREREEDQAEDAVEDLASK